MHFKLDTGESAPYSVQPPGLKDKAKPLYVDNPGNALMNDFGIYLMDQLCMFQCMGTLKIKENKDIFQFLDESYPAIGSNGRASVPMTYVWSKELIAYVETLLYVSPFYRQDDPRILFTYEDQYEFNLARYAQVTYDKLHKYMAKKITAWLKTFPHKDDIDYNEHAVPPPQEAGNAIGNIDPEAHILDVSEDDGNATEHVLPNPAELQRPAETSSDDSSSTSSDSDTTPEKAGEPEGGDGGPGQ